MTADRELWYEATDSTQGVWVVYAYENHAPYLVATFRCEIDALRYAVNETHGSQVTFLPHGVLLEEHLSTTSSTDNA